MGDWGMCDLQMEKKPLDRMQYPGLLSRVGNRFLLRALMFITHLKFIYAAVLRFFFHRTSQEQTSIYWTLSFWIAPSLS